MIIGMQPPSTGTWDDLRATPPLYRSLPPPLFTAAVLTEGHTNAHYLARAYLALLYERE